MTEYHKIETLFERDERSFVVDPTRLRSKVLGTISSWDVTEKIDGTNIRVTLAAQGDVMFGGRTDAAQIPADLIQYLIQTFKPSQLCEVLWPDGPANVVLYGEGYGAGIQKGGGLYRRDKAFILFDVLVNDQWWLGREAVAEIGAKLGVSVVPYLGQMGLPQIVELVQKGFSSNISSAAQAEGIVARPIEPLYDKRMKRVIIKLKTKDFVGGKTK